MSAERLTGREQATPEELEQFIVLATTPAGEDGERTLLQSIPLIERFEGIYSYAECAVADGCRGRGLSKLYDAIYPETGNEERIDIALVDAAAIWRTHYLHWESYNDPSGRQYAVDKEFLDNATFGLALNEERSRFDLPIHEETLEASPLYQQRIEQGMPRLMQLFVAAQAMQRLRGYSAQHRHEYTNAFYHLPGLWDLSDDETRLVTSLVANRGDEFAPRLVSLMAADERLLGRYRDENGVIDVEYYGGQDALLASAQDAFRAYLRFGHASEEGQEWLEMESNLAVELADIFPDEAREAIRAGRLNDGRQAGQSPIAASSQM